MANIIITGTSRGIGFELVRLLAAKGHNILALSRNEKTIKNLDLPGVRAISFDLGNTDQIDNLPELLDSFEQSVDVLIHNAGKLLNKPFLETSSEEFQEVYRVNVFGLAHLTRVLLPHMTKDGHVLTISSMGGVQGSAKFPGLSAYSSSKAAVITLTELWAEEFKESGPSFNVLALGAVQTEMLAEAFPGYQAPVTAEEMAEFIAGFALSGQRYFNGKVLPVSSSTP